MTISLRRQRENAFLQLDRLTVRRRRLLAHWLDNAMDGNRFTGAYRGMTDKEMEEVDRTLRDIRVFCATEERRV